MGNVFVWFQVSSPISLHLRSNVQMQYFCKNVQSTRPFQACRISEEDVCSSSTVGCFLSRIESPLNREPCHREQSQACGYCRNPAISQQHRSLSRNWVPVSPQSDLSERSVSCTRTSLVYFKPLSRWKPCHQTSGEVSWILSVLHLCSTCQTYDFPNMAVLCGRGPLPL